MRHILSKFFVYMICVGLFISHTHDVLAKSPSGVGYLNYSCGRGTGAAPTCVECSSSCTVIANTCTPPSGETFIGWRQSTVGTIYQPGDTINAAGGEPIMCDGFNRGWTLTAQYESAGATYTVTYSCNGGTGTAPSNQTATENQSFTPAANTCTKNGYAFTGWAVSGTNDVKPAGTAFTWTYNENKTFTAQWTGNTIAVNWYDGEDELTGANVAGSCTYGNTFNVPTPEARTGYVFMGWKSHTKTCPEITDQTTCNNTTGCIYNTYVSACKNYIGDDFFGCYDIPDTGTCDDYAFGSGRPGCHMLCYSYGGAVCSGGCGGAGI